VMLARLLESQGFRTARARNAAEARSLVAEGAYALIVVDIVMPGESGLDFAAFARDAYPTTPIVLISGYANDETGGFASQHERVTFVRKPFGADQFLDLVQGALTVDAITE
jgi:two-component system, OmpR family, response regulator